MARPLRDASLFRAIALALAGALSGCVTGAGADSTTKEPIAQRPAGAMDLGPIDDESLCKAVYKGLESRLAKTLTVGEDAEEATEIGDYDAFHFTIIKLTRGSDDVSGDPHAVPDGMDVEVSGWFKRTVKESGDSKPQCTSFDAVVTMLKKQGDWTLSDDHPITFGREDPEDCYQ